jgi:proton-dependent oligopeptide transporter, POT family
MTAVTSADAELRSNGRTFLGHPIGLAFLFFTEMWERVSYYGMRALLIYYLTEQLLLPGHAENVIGYGGFKSFLEMLFGPMSIQAISSQIYGLYTAFVYASTLFGGLLADRVLGQRKSVFIGGVLMALGQFMLMSEALFLPALLVLICGNGCFKANISTQVGNLYAPGDARRDSAFSLFYVGVNIGAALAPIICGTIGEYYGWKYGFMAAGIGMIVGLIIFRMGRRHLPPDTLTQARESGKEHGPLTKSDKNAIWALIVIAILNTFFWATYEQQGNTFALWARDYTDRSLFGLIEIPVTWFQSFNPILIFTLTPFLVAFWARQRARDAEPTAVTKMAIGCGLVGVAYLILTIPALMIGETGKASVMWSIVHCAVLTLGELYLSPVGLSLFSKVAPIKFVSMMMGVNFLSNFLGNYLQGWLGSFWEQMAKSNFWLLMAAIAIGAGIAIQLFNKPLNRIIAERMAQHRA